MAADPDVTVSDLVYLLVIIGGLVAYAGVLVYIVRALADVYWFGA